MLDFYTLFRCIPVFVWNGRPTSTLLQFYTSDKNKSTIIFDLMFMLYILSC
jgi:hypothetical protein